ncbi:DUF4386 domain-containing protein [Vannielia litorea]|uniref:DUF4386 domain-containing protein n=1 Tax=Vannielia litorea TaxID=1217970 RepID=A0A1N6EHD0_9RHOB|nr:DUF4386 domain-containing protein [Vannielia litorea]SIN82458.1 protein of unknown function [Vannielia litorea]
MTQGIQRTIGALYLGVIALGLAAEFGIRMPLISWNDPAGTWQAIAANIGLFRMSLLAESAMILLDIGLAVLFFALLRRVHPELALAAMVLRLMQAAVISGSLLASVAALSLVAGEAAQPRALMVLLTTHSIGYDVGLIFFGANTLITAWLLARSGLVPRWLPPLLALAGLVYLAGSLTRLAAPPLNALMQPAYLVTIVAELSLALVFLLRPRAGPISE